MTRPIYLHIGVSKSGTSSLQEGLRRSGEQLAALGLAQPIVGRSPMVQRLIVPLGWTDEEGYTGPVDPRALTRLTARLRRTPGDRLLISCEDLADASPAAVEALGGALMEADLEPRVIVTARSWARQLPAEYQQFLKIALTQTYEQFLTDVREDRGEPASAARRFRDRQQLSRIVAAWGPLVPSGTVDVVVVPPFAVDPTFVYRSMEGLLGLDTGELREVKGEVNQSFGVVEAELLRRINVLARRRLREREDYNPAIRQVLVRQTIRRGASARLALPPAHLDWVRAVAEEELELLRAGGHTLHGDPDGLLPAPGDVQDPPEIGDRELAAVAVSTLTDFAVRTHRQRQLKRPYHFPGDPVDTAGPARRLARAAVRRLRD